MLRRLAHIIQYQILNVLCGSVPDSKLPDECLSCHYETIMRWGRTAFGELAVGLGVNQQKYIGIDWVKEKGISLKNYDAPAMSEGDLKFHAKRLEDIPHLDKAMKDCNPYIYKKYLTRYNES